MNDVGSTTLEEKIFQGFSPVRLAADGRNKMGGVCLRKGEQEYIEEFFKKATDEEMYRYFRMIEGGCLAEMRDAELISLVRRRPKSMAELFHVVGLKRANGYGRTILRCMPEKREENRHPRTARVLWTLRDGPTPVNV